MLLCGFWKQKFQRWQSVAFEADLVTFIEADAPVAALVAARVYPLNLPQAPTMPAIVYQTISAVVLDHSHDGAGRVLRARVQMSCWAATYVALADALRAALDGYAGAMGDTTIGSTLLQNERDDWGSEQTGDWRKIQDYFVMYIEAV